MNIFAKAAQNLPLTPSERAFLKLLKGWLYTALSAALVAGAQYLGNGQLDYVRLAYIVGGAFGISLLQALDKYFSAKGDAPMALVAEVAEQKIEQLQAQPAPVVSAPQVSFPKPAMAGVPKLIPAEERHFGDSQVIPTVNPQ